MGVKSLPHLSALPVITLWVSEVAAHPGAQFRLRCGATRELTKRVVRLLFVTETLVELSHPTPTATDKCLRKDRVPSGNISLDGVGLMISY